MNRASAVNHARSAGSYRGRPTWRRSTAFSWREHENLGVPRLVPAEYQDSDAEQPAHQQIEDLEKHLASQPPPCQARGKYRQVNLLI